MANGNFVAYYRVSTAKQGASGLGLEAQRESVAKFLNGGDWNLVGEFTEVESGKKNDRPALAKALRLCRLNRATLVIAKLDRLARNTLFLLTIVKDSGDDGVVFCDLPAVPAGPVGKFLVTQMASVAELEAGVNSQRTKDALRAAKARGVVLGGDRGDRLKIASVAHLGNVAGNEARTAKAAKRTADIKPVIEDIKEAGAVTLRQIAAALNERGITTARGKAWTSVQVMRVQAA